MLLPPVDALHVQHDQARRLLRFQWLDSMNLRLRAGLVYGRDLVVAHKPAHILVDFNGLPQLTVQEELWMSVNWLPAIAAQPIRMVALVYSDVGHLHNQMAAETLLWLGRHLIGFQYQVFHDVPAALFWLTNSDEAVEQLQAEWLVAVPKAALRATRS